MACLFLMNYSDKQIFLTVEVGIQSAPGITGILRDLLRHSAAKPVTQKVLRPTAISVARVCALLSSRVSRFRGLVPLKGICVLSSSRSWLELVI